MPEKDDDNPESTGESSTSKSKRKRTRVPLKGTVKKRTESRKRKDAEADEEPRRESLVDLAEKQVEAAKAEKSAEADGAEEEQTAETDKKDAEQSEPLELPEVAPDEYGGELIIDHSEDAEPNLPLNPEAETGQVDVIEALSGGGIEEAPAELPEAEAGPPAGPPPAVAPPLLFGAALERPSHAEAEPPAPESRPAEPIPVATETAGSPADNLRGRLSEEWAAVRRRAQQAEAGLITEEEAGDKAYLAEKRGLRRGVVSGGIVGYLIGRRGRRVAEHRAEAAHIERERTIERLASERASNLDSLEKRDNILKRTQEELNEMMKRSWDKRVLKRDEAAPEAAPAAPAEQPVLQVQSAPEARERAVSIGQMPESIPASGIEAAGETGSEDVPEKDKTLQLPEAPPEYKPVAEETYQPPEGRRVEASAWHRIEVDEKTGRAVENPSLEYGEEFKLEQSQEKLAQEAAKAQTAAQVGMTVISSGTEESKDPLVPKNLAKSPSVSLITKDEFNKEAAAVIRQVVKNTSSPATWIAAFVIVILLLLADIL